MAFTMKKFTQAQPPPQTIPGGLASDPANIPGPIEHLPEEMPAVEAQVGADVPQVTITNPEEGAKARKKVDAPPTPEGAPVEPKTPDLGQFQADHLARLQQAAAQQGNIRVVQPDDSSYVILPPKKGK